MMREAEYFSVVGPRGHFEAYPGQPFEEFTPESCADIQDWVIGTPDDVINWVEERIKTPGGLVV